MTLKVFIRLFFIVFFCSSITSAIAGGKTVHVKNWIVSVQFADDVSTPTAEDAVGALIQKLLWGSDRTSREDLAKWKTTQVSLLESGSEEDDARTLPACYATLFLLAADERTKSGTDPELVLLNLAQSLERCLEVTTEGLTEKKKVLALSFPELKNEVRASVDQALMSLEKHHSILEICAQHKLTRALKFFTGTFLGEVPTDPENHPIIQAFRLRKQTFAQALIQARPELLTKTYPPYQSTLFHLLVNQAEADDLRAVFSSAPELLQRLTDKKTGLLWKKDSFNSTPFLFASDREKDEMLRYLVSLDPESPLLGGENGFGICRIAIRRGHLEFLRAFLESHPSVLKRSDPKTGQNLLHQAVQEGKPQEAALIYQLSPSLMDEIADFQCKHELFGDDSVFTRRSTPLEGAIAKDDAEMIEALVAAGYKPTDAKIKNSKTKGTLLHFAASTGRRKALWALLEAGLDPNARDRFGSLPGDGSPDEGIQLMLAVWRGFHKAEVTGVADQLSHLVPPGEKIAVFSDWHKAFPLLSRWMNPVFRQGGSQAAVSQWRSMWNSLPKRSLDQLFHQAAQRIAQGGEHEGTLEVALEVEKFRNGQQAVLDLESFYQAFSSAKSSAQTDSKYPISELRAQLQAIKDQLKVALQSGIDLKSHFARLKTAEDWLKDFESQKNWANNSAASVGKQLAPLESPESLLMDSGDSIDPSQLSLELLKEWASRSVQEQIRVYERFYELFQTDWKARLSSDFPISELTLALRSLMNHPSTESTPLVRSLRSAIHILGEFRVASYILTSSHPDLIEARKKIREALEVNRTNVDTEPSGEAEGLDAPTEEISSEESSAESYLVLSPEIQNAWETQLAAALKDRGFRDFLSKIIMSNKRDATTSLGRDHLELENQLFEQVSKLPSRFKIRKTKSGQGFVVVDLFATALGLETRSVGSHRSHGRMRSDYGIDWNVMSRLRNLFSEAGITQELLDDAS